MCDEDGRCEDCRCETSDEPIILKALEAEVERKFGSPLSVLDGDERAMDKAQVCMIDIAKMPLGNVLPSGLKPPSIPAIAKPKIRVTIGIEFLQEIIDFAKFTKASRVDIATENDGVLCIGWKFDALVPSPAFAFEPQIERFIAWGYIAPVRAGFENKIPMRPELIESHVQKSSPEKVASGGPVQLEAQNTPDKKEGLL